MESKNYREEIRLAITQICDNWKLKAPITVPSAAKMIADYISLDVAIELYEGAIEEVKGDIFKMSAYKATLETILYPMRTKL